MRILFSKNSFWFRWGLQDQMNMEGSGDDVEVVTDVDAALAEIDSADCGTPGDVWVEVSTSFPPAFPQMPRSTHALSLNSQDTNTQTHRPMLIEYALVPLYTQNPTEEESEEWDTSESPVGLKDPNPLTVEETKL
jgi:hypothetical protein